jgi:cysteine-rich repeat protein
MSRFSTTLGSVFLLSGLTLGACATNSELLDAPGTTDESDAGTGAKDAGEVGKDDGTGVIDSGGVKPSPDAGAVCGNGKVEPGEACDDGNLVDMDGCSSLCVLESTSAADVCPGVAIPLTAEPGQALILHGSVTSSTSGAYHHYAGGCGGGSGRDVVYTIKPAASGKAVVKLTADFPAIISSRTTCDDEKTESKCGGIQAATGGETTLEVPVFADTPAYIIVDGYGGTSGNFTLDVEVSTASCGNGIAELPEQCDDGNTTNGDGCSSECSLETGGIVNDCPGQPFVLSGAPGAVRKISFAGNTATQGARTQSPTGCFYGAGPNMVYALKADISGSVAAHLNAGYANANLHARSDCGSNDYQLGCTQREEAGALDIEFPVKQDQWFYLFVEGNRSGTTDFAGPFSLDVTLTPSACGDGVLGGGEQCDDGNNVSGDGCSATCALEAYSDVGTCPGHPVTLAAQPDGRRSLTFAGSTAGQTSSFGGCLLASGGGPDVVYSVTPDINGLLDARLTGAFNSIVFVRSTCDADAAATNVLDCSYKANASTTPYILDGLGSVPKHVSAPVVAGSTYYVVVDSSSSSGSAASGAFKLDLTVSPAVCGNSVIEGGEQCDDGGTDDNDGCSSTCQFETTGPRTCAAAEAVALQSVGAGTWAATLARGTTGFDATHNFNTSTTNVCYAPGREAYFAVTAPAAGILRASVASSAFDTVIGVRKPCATSGNPLLCVNNVPKGSSESLATPIAAGETLWIVVDSASATDFGRFTLNVEITPSGCGDGFFVPSVDELCDDGNTVSGDGCSATCKVEPIAGADTCPGVTLTMTGTGSQPRKGVITLDTRTLSPDYASSCGGNAQDGVVRVVPNMNGILYAQIKNLPGGLVHARSTCTDPTTEFKKSTYSTCPSVVHEVIQFPVQANKEYFLFVDGLDGVSGIATLDVTISP